MQQFVPLKTNEYPTPEILLQLWQRHLQEHDRSPGTVKKYTQAIAHFCSWYEQGVTVFWRPSAQQERNIRAGW